jgi:hypothetical protein
LQPRTALFCCGVPGQLISHSESDNCEAVSSTVALRSLRSALAFFCAPMLTDAGPSSM